MYFLDTPPDVNNPLGWPTWLLIVAVILFIVGIVIALVTGREVTFIPPKIGEKKSEPLETKTSIKLKKDYGIKILTPGANTVHRGTVIVTGTFTTAPPAGSVRAFVINEGTNEYWPKKEIVFDSHNGTWNTEVHVGNTVAGNRKILICTIGKNAFHLIEYYIKVAKQQCYVGISFNDTLREDMHIHAQIVVKMIPVTPA